MDPSWSQAIASLFALLPGLKTRYRSATHQTTAVARLQTDTDLRPKLREFEVSVAKCFRFLIFMHGLFAHHLWHIAVCGVSHVILVTANVKEQQNKLQVTGQRTNSPVWRSTPPVWYGLLSNSNL